MFLGEELRGPVRHALITQTKGDRELGEELVHERREKLFCGLRLGFHDCAGEHFESVVTRNCTSMRLRCDSGEYDEGED